MINILQQYNLLKKTIGIQKIDDKELYRASRLCVTESCDDGILLYNTLTGELLLLSSNEYDTWESFTKLGYAGYCNDDMLISTLIKKWFIVPASFDEFSFCDQIRSMARLLSYPKDKKNYFVVFTTTECNARCYYCFEHGQKKRSMSSETAADVAEYILKNGDHNKTTIRWFGGEPLYNASVIDIISKRLREAGMIFNSVMFTNAYLFDREKIEAAKNTWNLRQVITTLDGTEDIYNRTKAYVGCTESAYVRVMGNIEDLIAAGINITINLAMDGSNADDLETLTYELCERFKGCSRIAIRCELLKEYVTPVKGFDSDVEAFERWNRLNEVICSYNLGPKELLPDSLKINSCMADAPGSVTIMTDGRLGRCGQFSDSEVVGSIYSTDFDQERIQSWTELRPEVSECRSCSVYPLCMRLKKCNACSDECTELHRKQALKRLRMRMMRTYERSETGLIRFDNSGA